jgi:hypothetical protein
MREAIGLPDTEGLELAAEGRAADVRDVRV